MGTTDMEDDGKSDIRDLLFKPGPELSSKLWIIATRLTNPCPLDQILQHIKSVSFAAGEEDRLDYPAIEIRSLGRCTSPQLGECTLRGRVHQQAD